MLKLLKPLLLIFMINGSALGQNHQQSQVLAIQQGYQYTEAHFQTIVQFTEFLINQPLNMFELQTNRQEAIYNFNQNPAAAIQDVNEISNSMQQLYATQNLTQIALVRSAILCQFYTAINQSGESPYVWQLIQTYSNILAYDTDNNLVLTQKDVNGYLALMEFYAQISGQQFYLNWNELQQFQQLMVQSFLQGTLEDRQSLVSMALMDDYVLGSYQQMSYNEQQNFTNSYLNQNNNYNNNNSSYSDYNEDNLWPPGVSTTQEKQAYIAQRQAEIEESNYFYNTLSNMQLESHVTTMNIIESMGETSNYWEVDYDDY